jgi:hypothetical protein
VAISSARDYARSRPAASRGSYASLKTEQYEPVEVEEVKSAAPAVSYTKTESDYTYTAPTRKQSQSSTAAVDREANERVAHEQNLNAKYTFASAVNDGIMDQSQVRQETRDGLKVRHRALLLHSIFPDLLGLLKFTFLPTQVTGSYSYTDGFIKKTVHYTADEDVSGILRNSSNYK